MNLGTSFRRARIVVFALLMASAANAQVAGTISGYVRDPSGAAVAGANVVAVLTGQQLSRSTLADATGFYNLLAMQPGVYEITITFEALRSRSRETFA